jgi:hypothetical protein
MFRANRQEFTEVRGGTVKNVRSNPMPADPSQHLGDFEEYRGRTSGICRKERQSHLSGIIPEAKDQFYDEERRKWQQFIADRENCYLLTDYWHTCWGNAIFQKSG